MLPDQIKTFTFFLHFFPKSSQLEMVTSQNLSETFPLRGVFSSLSGYREIGKINLRECLNSDIINALLLRQGVTLERSWLSISLFSSSVISRRFKPKKFTREPYNKLPDLKVTFFVKDIGLCRQNFVINVLV